MEVKIVPGIWENIFTQTQIEIQINEEGITQDKAINTDRNSFKDTRKPIWKLMTEYVSVIIQAQVLTCSVKLKTT